MKAFTTAITIASITLVALVPGASAKVWYRTPAERLQMQGPSAQTTCNTSRPPLPPFLGGAY